MQWYLSVLKNYVGFSGRARRKEYWMFTLINAIVGAIINVIQLILGLPCQPNNFDNKSFLECKFQMSPRHVCCMIPDS